MNDKEKDMILEREFKIRLLQEAFYKKIINGYTLDNLNGFLALGILKKSTDHINKKVNTMWFFGVGVGKTENEIVVHTDMTMTIDEVEGFIEVLTEGLKIAKKLGVKRTNKPVTFYEKEFKRGKYQYWIIGNIDGIPGKEIEVLRKEKKDKHYKLIKSFSCKTPIHIVLEFCNEDSL